MSSSPTPHPLDALLEIWNRISDGQRDAIARDFGIKTGGVMRRAHSGGTVLVPLIATHRHSLQPGLLTNPDASLPCIPVVPGQSPEDTLKVFVSALIAPTHMEGLYFELFATPIVSGPWVYLFYTSSRALTTQEYDQLNVGPDWPVLDAADLSVDPKCACVMSKWNSIMPLRYVSRA